MATDEEFTEPDDLGEDHDVPTELVELHEVLEWEASVAENQAG